MAAKKKTKRRQRPSKAQRALLELLHERHGHTCTVAEILKKTGWKKTSWRVYQNNGLFDSFIKPAGKDIFQVHCPSTVDEWEFYRRTSQTSHAREFAAPCQAPLARALLRRSRDNMILALELYNRPSLENRLDAFVLLFCAAWEQLLKAEIVENDRDDAIFRRHKPGRPRETISLREAMALRMKKSDLEAKNLEKIIGMRDQATHFLMPEAQGDVSLLFQSGILNFLKRYTTSVGQPLLPVSVPGLLSLVGDRSPPEVIALKQQYGELAANELASFLADLRSEIASNEDERFAIGVTYSLRLTKREQEGDITLAKAGSGEQHGILVEKPVSAEDTHPYLTNELCKEVSKQTKVRFTTHDLLALCHKEKWKRSNNEFHRFQKKPGTHFYSDRAVRWIVEKTERAPDYLERARGAYLKHSRKKRQAGAS